MKRPILYVTQPLIQEPEYLIILCIIYFSQVMTIQNIYKFPAYQKTV